MLKAISTITNAIGALNYKGTWNASSNTPTLADGTGAKGDYYVVSTAGTQTFDGVQLFFGLGDWIVYNGAVWQRVEGGSDGNFANVTLTSTDAGATASPLLELYRDSATPAASDTLGEIEFNGEDSAGNKQAYGLIHASILSPTSTAEQGQLHFETATAGALTEKMIIGTTNLVINEIGAVFNVRIEGDTDANLFYTDATNSRIGVGTASPAEKLDVVGKIKVSDNIVIGTTAKGITTGSSIPLGLGTNTGTSSVTILTTGSVVIGGTSSNENGSLTVAPNNTVGAAQMTWNRATSASGATAVVFRDASNLVGSIVYSDLGTSYNITSDYRLKENIVPMIGALEKIAALKPCTYTWKRNGKAGQGFIAHELQAVVPDCVVGEKDAVETVDLLDDEGKIIGVKEEPQYQGIDTSFLVATLVAAIQELKAEVDALKARG